MPDQKRALVVDDSKSARLVLRRMLEKHAIIVDTVESAATALDFLNYNRPDVIFLDHMMPGMDGFQAIRAIKNNPDTATIPVMMYTSKGGDLYLGQARALGAVGVLPKTVAPAELFESLQRLGLIHERRSKDREAEENGASERAEDIQKRPASAASYKEPAMMPVGATGDPLDSPLRKLLDEQRVEIRKDMLLSIETVSRQTGTRLAREMEEKLAALQAPAAPSTGTAKLPLLVLGGLLLLSMAWNFSAQKKPQQPLSVSSAPEAAVPTEQNQKDQLQEELQGIRNELTKKLNDSWQTTAWALNQSLNYAYDEIALDDGRIEVIEQLLTQLRNGGYTGKVILESHVGEFCLLGDAEQGFRLPPPELSVDQCEFIGNPVQAADIPAAHQSLSFANFIASTPLLESSTYTLEVAAASRADPLYSYPPKSEQTSAYVWNRVAEQNNRVIIRLQPGG